MIERIFIIATICNNNCTIIIDPASPDVQEAFISEADFITFVSLDKYCAEVVIDDEVFVLSPYQLVQCLPYFMQIEPVVQGIVRPHLRMNFKFRNKYFVIRKRCTGRLTEKRRPFVYIYLISFFQVLTKLDVY